MLQVNSSSKWGIFLGFAGMIDSDDKENIFEVKFSISFV